MALTKPSSGHHATARPLAPLAILSGALWSGCLPAQEPGEGPIVAAALAWTFVHFDQAQCADGSRTGIGVNLAPESRELVIYLQGGGACDTAEGCLGLFPSAANMRSGYGALQLGAEPNLSGIVFLDRLALDNPWRDANLVFVPYCTGDLHAGDHATTYEVDGAGQRVEHRGHANLAAYLTRLVPTFAALDRVFLIGASAGGFGALFNSDQVRAAFAPVPVHTLSDSGPPVEVPAAMAARWRERWRIALPPECEACAQHPERILEHLAGSASEARIGLLGSLEDAVLSHYLEITPQDFRDRMDALAPRVEALDQVHAFVTAGQGHVVIANRLVAAGGQSLGDWLRAFARGDAGWSDAWEDRDH